MASAALLVITNPPLGPGSSSQLHRCGANRKTFRSEIPHDPAQVQSASFGLTRFLLLYPEIVRRLGDLRQSPAGPLA